MAAHVQKYDDHAYSEVSEQEYVPILVQIVPPKNTDLGSSKLSWKKVLTAAQIWIPIEIIYILCPVMASRGCELNTTWGSKTPLLEAEN